MNDYLQLEFISLLLNQGYSLHDIVSILEISFHSNEIKIIQYSLQQGDSIEQAILSCYKDKYFQEYFPFFLKRNNISVAINQTLQLCKRQRSFVTQLRKQLQYPFFLLVFLFFFSIFVTCFLLPQVRLMIIDFGSQLSFLQEIVFLLFQIIPFVVFMSILLIIILCIHILKNIHNKNQAVLIQYLNTPIIQILLKKYYSLKFAFYYNELLQSEYDSSQVIEFLATFLKNHDLQVVIYPLKKQIEAGISFEQCVSKCIYFEDLFIQYIHIMQKQKDAKNLNDYINLSSKLVERKMEHILMIIIPCIYCFVALFVVFVYLSIILPLMNVIEGI